EDIPKRVVLERDALAAELRRRLDERSPDVPVLDEPFAERDAAPARIADGGGYRAVRHWNHHVGHGRVLVGKGLAHTLACRIDRGASKIARGRREVDMLEDAQTTSVRGEVGDRHRAGVVDPQHLSRRDVAAEPRADRLERAGLARDQPGAAPPTEPP